MTEQTPLPDTEESRKEQYLRQQELLEDYEEFGKIVNDMDGQCVLELIETANDVKAKYQNDRRALIKDADLLKTVAVKKSKYIKKYAVEEPGVIDIKQLSVQVKQFVNASNIIPDEPYDLVSSTFTALSIDASAQPAFDDIRIARLGRIGMRYGKVARGSSHLIGALEKERPQRVRVSKPRQKETDPGKARVAKELKGDEIDSSKNNIQRYGGIMRNKLNQEYQYRKQQGEVLPMLQAIIDPRSFESTVQNFFVFSTLVAGGMAKLSENDDNTPVIEMCDDEETSRLVSDRNSRCPVVLEMDYDTYNKILDAYDMRDQEPLLELGDTTMGLNAE